MRKKNGFTLIELLIVISILAILLSLLIPALQKARKQAKAAVCVATLKHWAFAYHLYAEDHKGKLPEFIGGTVHSTTFMENLRDYYADINNMRTCPEAKLVSTEIPTTLEPLSFFGDTYSAWQVDPVAIWVADEDWGIGSYGENSWIRKTDNPNCWGRIDAKGEARIDEIPILMDARWNNFWAQDTNPWNNPAVVNNYGLGYWNSMATALMRRHNDGINMCFLDASARPVPAEELWNLRWHGSFERQGTVDLSWLD